MEKSPPPGMRGINVTLPNGERRLTFVNERLDDAQVTNLVKNTIIPSLSLPTKRRPDGSENANWAVELSAAALRIVPPVIAQVLATPLTPAGQAIAGSTTATVFDGVAQGVELLAGTRKDLNPSQMFAQGLIGAVPFGMLKGIGKLSTIGKGAAFGAGATTLTNLAETGELPSLGQATLGATVGGVAGAVAPWFDSPGVSMSLWELENAATNRAGAILKSINEPSSQMKAAMKSDAQVSAAIIKANKALRKPAPGSLADALPDDVNDLVMLKRLAMRYTLDAATTAIRKLDPSGKLGLSTLADGLERVQMNAELRAAPMRMKFMAAYNSRNLEDNQDVIWQFMDGRIDFPAFHASVKPETVKAALGMRAVYAEMRTDAQKLGVYAKHPVLFTRDVLTQKETPFTGIDTPYINRRLIPDLAKTGSKLQKEVVAALRKQGMSKGEAKQTVLDAVSRDQNNYRRMANIETGRTGRDLPDFAYEKRLDVLADLYIMPFYRKLEEAQAFGRDNRHALQLMDKAAIINPRDAAFAREVYNRFEGVEDSNLAVANLLNNLQSAEVVLKLGPGTAVAQVGQLINVAMDTGWGNTWNALRNLNLSKDEADRGGIFLRQAASDAYTAYAGPGREGKLGVLADWWLNKSGITVLDRLGRIVGAGAGRAYFDQLAEKLLTNPKHAETIRRLNNLGFDHTKVITAKRAYNQLAPDAREASAFRAMESKAARQVSLDSNLSNSILDLPMTFTDPRYRPLTQFKSFSVGAVKRLWSHVVKETLNQNFRPMVTLMTAGFVVGEGIADVRAALKWQLAGRGEDKDDFSLTGSGLIAHMLAGDARASDIIHNYTALGLFGLFQELYEASQYGVGGALAGPLIGDVVDTFDAAFKSAWTFADSERKKPGTVKPIVKELVKTFVPAGYGNVIARPLFPKPPKKQQAF